MLDSYYKIIHKVPSHTTRDLLSLSMQKKMSVEVLPMVTCVDKKRGQKFVNRVSTDAFDVALAFLLMKVKKAWAQMNSAHAKGMRQKALSTNTTTFVSRNYIFAHA